MQNTRAIFEKRLIAEVKRHPCMWDARRMGHRNRDGLNESWKNIAEELDVPEAQCRSRWRSLRDTFISARRNRTNWYLSSEMSFLLTVLDSGNNSDVSTDTEKNSSKDSDRLNERRTVYELIEAIKGHEVLWNTAHIDYKHPGTRDEAWADISSRLKQPVVQIRTRWRSLRDRFVVELKRAQETGQDIRTRKWAYCERLLFLRDVVSPFVRLNGRSNNPGSVNEATMDSMQDYDLMEASKKEPTGAERKNVDKEALERSLIAEVKKHSCLWDTHSLCYKKKTHIDGAWRAIAAAVGKPDYFCRGRWALLRRRFASEMQWNGNVDDGSTRWHLFDEMVFLLDVNADKEDEEDEMLIESVCESDGNDSNDPFNNVRLKDENESTSRKRKAPYNEEEASSNDCKKPLLFVDVFDENFRNDEEDAQSLQLEDIMQEEPAALETAGPTPRSRGIANTTTLTNIPKFIQTMKRLLVEQDPYILALKEIFEKVPEKQQIGFKLDILTYANAKLTELCEKL